MGNMYNTPASLLFAWLWLASFVVGKAPNIVFIISDDQDRRLGSLNYMPNVQRSIVAEGVNVANHFGTVALCCPARATLLRGQAAHNTNVTHVGGPA
jgi:N-acetylglucosamine-6-sulfatase